MEINKKRYRDFDTYFKLKFKKKIIKLPLDGNFTCPNRDGTLSNKGCIYCSENGAGDFTKRINDINLQIDYQIKRLKKSGRNEGYMAFFQNFTSTYGHIKKLRETFYKAINNPNIMGLSIATRVDCLDEEVLNLLEEINKKTFLIVELGLQSVNEETISFINRGYSHKVFDENLNKLNKLNIRTVAHIIIGLPNEDKDDFIKDISYINKRKFWGLKIHNLYIEEKTDIFKFYKENKDKFTMTLDQYTDYVVMILGKLNPDVVVQRLTGDGRKDKIVWPIWSKNKASVLSTIDRKLKIRNIRQGDLWKEE